MTVADLLVTISANSQGLRKELNAVKRNIKSAFGTESIKLSEQVASKFKGIAAGAAALGIASVKMNADMEMTARAFEVLTGSSDRAQKHLSQLEQFAATTPFEFPGLVDASKKLLAYGFQTEAVIPIMEAVGNAAMAVGLGQEGIDRITLALGQMNAKGKVSAEEMRQLAETGLPAWELLAKGIGVSVPEAMDMARKSAITAKEGISALLSGLDSRFNGMMDKVSGEIPQSFSNMQDSVKSIMRSTGASITDAFDLKTKMKDRHPRSLRPDGAGERKDCSGGYIRHSRRHRGACLCPACGKRDRSDLAVACDRGGFRGRSRAHIFKLGRGRALLDRALERDSICYQMGVEHIVRDIRRSRQSL